MSEQLSLLLPRALRNLQRNERLLSLHPPTPNRARAGQEERVDLQEEESSLTAQNSNPHSCADVNG